MAVWKYESKGKILGYIAAKTADSAKRRMKRSGFKVVEPILIVEKTFVWCYECMTRESGVCHNEIECTLDPPERWKIEM